MGLGGGDRSALGALVLLLAPTPGYAGERPERAVSKLYRDADCAQDASLAAGTTQVQSEGKPGLRMITAEYVSEDGATPVERILSEHVTPPQDRVVRVGTKAVATDAGFAYTQAIQGSATSYCLTGSTATGTNAGPGSIAVDPSVIRLGSHLYVSGYGYGWAVDTGSAIKGTLVDVWYTCDQAIQWGRRPVTI